MLVNGVVPHVWTPAYISMVEEMTAMSTLARKKSSRSEPRHEDKLSRYVIQNTRPVPQTRRTAPLAVKTRRWSR